MSTAPGDGESSHRGLLPRPGDASANQGLAQLCGCCRRPHSSSALVGAARGEGAVVLSAASPGAPPRRLLAAGVHPGRVSGVMGSRGHVVRGPEGAGQARPRGMVTRASSTSPGRWGSTEDRGTRVAHAQ